MKKVNIELQDLSYHMGEEMKTLRTNIQFCGDDKQVILFTSCVLGEGKSSTSVELARSLSELNKAVLFIDADMRKSVLESRLSAQGADKGLSHFLSGQCTLADAVFATEYPKLHMMLAGPLVPNPTELLSTERFKKMLESFRKVYDYIIIDTPPLGMVIDTAIIARDADGAIIVVEAAKTKYRLAQNVKAKLEQAGCPVLGAVLNKVDRKKQGGYYSKYYGKQYGKSGYGYGEYYAADSESAKTKKRKKA